LEVKLAEQEGAKVDFEMKRRLVKEEQEAIKREHAERKEQEDAVKEALVNWRLILLMRNSLVFIASFNLQAATQLKIPNVTSIMTG
jgi:hypothetical protein